MWDVFNIICKTICAYILKQTDANRLAKNRRGPRADGEYSASVAPIDKDLGNPNGGRIIILHGSANDAHEFPVVFPWVLHTGCFVNGVGVYCVRH